MYSDFGIFLRGFGFPGEGVMVTIMTEPKIQKNQEKPKSFICRVFSHISPPRR